MLVALAMRGCRWASEGQQVRQASHWPHPLRQLEPDYGDSVCCWHGRSGAVLNQRQELSVKSLHFTCVLTSGLSQS